MVLQRLSSDYCTFITLEYTSSIFTSAMYCTIQYRTVLYKATLDLHGEEEALCCTCAPICSSSRGCPSKAQDECDTCHKSHTNIYVHLEGTCIEALKANNVYRLMLINLG